MPRTFTIQGSGLKYNGGRYKSDEVQSAAKKAATQLFRKLSLPEYRMHKHKTQIKFILRETTKGSEKKTFYYIGERSELSKPLILTIKGKEILYKYKYSVKKCNSDEYSKTD